MNYEARYILFFWTLMQVINCNANSFQNPTLSGTVKLNSTQEIMKDVRIFIDEREAVLSNEQGEFSMKNYNSQEEPVNVSAVKKGYELAVWSFRNNNVSITMRPATIKTIMGRLNTASGSPKADSKISYFGRRIHETTTDKDGYFIFRIPYEDEVSRQDRFVVDNEITKIEQFSEDIDAGKVEITLSELGAQTQNYKVEIKDEFNSPVKNTIVTMKDKSYFTNEDGLFQLEASNITSDLSDWKIDGFNVLSVETNDDEKSVIVVIGILKLSRDQTLDEIDSIQAAVQDENQLRNYTATQLISDIEKLEDFYTEKGYQFRQENERILSITDSLSKITVQTEVERTHVLFQIDKLNKSMASSAEAFNLINNNSLELIRILKLKLDEKNQTIKVIEEENVALITTISNNLTLFIAIVINFLLILFIALLTIRRFKTQNKVIQRTKRQLVDAQEIAKIGSMVYDYKNKCFTYSKNFFDTLKIYNFRRIIRLQSRSEGQIFKDLISESDKERVTELWKNGLAKHESFSTEFKGRADNAEEIHIDMNTKINKDSMGKLIGISSTLQDVSEKKKNELLLIEAVREAEEASKIKEEFLSSMSHEIRTPLNAIVGLSELLASENPRQSQLKNLTTIQFSSQHLLSLVNDILDFSKIRAGKVDIENRDINVKNLVNGIINTMEFKAKEVGISVLAKIESAVPDFVIGDELRINQILTNLIGNAIKFTRKGSVTLSLSLVKSKDNISEISFSVKDTGTGIAKDKLEIIFNSFEQENTSTAREYGGTGLGLAISKELVRLMGGDAIIVNSELGVGSEFCFSIPFKKASEHVKEEKNKLDKKENTNLQSNADVNVPPGVKVLCVDDNEINVLVISQYFKKWGVEATYAETGEKALEAFRNGSFDMVLMDIRLPDMDGYEVTNEIHREHPDRNVPIIALTAEINKQTLEKTHQTGMVDFLGKPFKSEDLKNLIIKYSD
ncbi:MAG: response regulator [Cytophagales bacterium]|nr:response regulator [Cytophagales bacterium]